MIGCGGGGGTGGGCNGAYSTSISGLGERGGVACTIALRFSCTHTHFNFGFYVFFLFVLAKMRTTLETTQKLIKHQGAWGHSIYFYACKVCVLFVEV